MFKYYVSEFRGLSKNAGGISMKMLTLPTLGKVWSIVVMWVGSLDDRAIRSILKVHNGSCGYGA